MCPRCEEVVGDIDKQKKGPLYICPINQCCKGYTHLTDFLAHIEHRHQDADKATILSNPTSAYMLNDDAVPSNLYDIHNQYPQAQGFHNAELQEYLYTANPNSPLVIGALANVFAGGTNYM
ncbi:hypothetical protein GJ496_011588 [Pomphorhynchus laevis]|nr:hypothetical protein GJ496_011637 [Pomphorhynchus laevis]KAI0980050.1 hypothetical protein GJ496_011588 [Pomphorhynchus laevis]